MTGYRICLGRTESLTLPHVVTEGDGVTLLDGYQDQHFETFTLSRILAIAIRTTPWCRWYLSPDWSPRGREGINQHAGLAWQHGFLIVCTSAPSPEFALEVAHHEAWHAAESWVPQDVLDQVAAELSGSEWPSEYLQRSEERLARAYAHYAALRDDGISMALPSASLLAVRLFDHVYSGQLGRQVWRHVSQYPDPWSVQPVAITTDTPIVVPQPRGIAKIFSYL